MSLRIVLRLVLALLWLSAGGYFFFFSPRLEIGMIDAPTAGLLAVLFMLWNLLRGLLDWQTARREQQAHDEPLGRKTARD